MDKNISELENNNLIDNETKLYLNDKYEKILNEYDLFNQSIYETDINDLNKNISDLNNEISLLRETLTQKENEISELNNEISELKKNISEFEQIKNIGKDLILQLNNKYFDILNKYNSLKLDKETEITILKNDIYDMNDKILSLIEIIKVKDNQISELEKNISEMKNNKLVNDETIIDLMGKLRNIKNEFKISKSVKEIEMYGLNGKISDLNKEISELKDTLTQKNNEISELKKNIENLDKNISELENNKLIDNKTITDLNDKYNEINNEYELFKVGKETDINDLNEKISDLNNEISQKITLINDLNKKIDELTKYKSADKEEISKLKKDLYNQTIENKQSISNLRIEIYDKISFYEDELIKKDQSINDLQQIINDLNNKLKLLENDLNKNKEISDKKN